MTVNTTLAAPEPDPARVHIDTLACRLGRASWYARVTTLPGGTVGLHVINLTNLASKRFVLVSSSRITT